jgi:hypothetical protein
MSVQSTARVTLCLLVPTVLASCAGPGPGLTGNDTGGIIPYASVSPELARDMAVEHCARYGKRPRATGVDAQYGGYYSFACRFDAKRPY